MGKFERITEQFDLELILNENCISKLFSQKSSKILEFSTKT